MKKLLSLLPGGKGIPILGRKKPKDLYVMLGVPMYRYPNPRTVMRINQMRDDIIFHAGVACEYLFCPSSDASAARNEIWNKFMARKQGTHLVFIDDDMDFPVSAEKRINPALRLVLHGKPLVTYPCYTRYFPTQSVLRHRLGPREYAHFGDPTSERFQDDVDRLLKGEPWEFEGAAGLAFCCIAREVFEALPDTPFDHIGKMKEDISFFERCHEAGFKPWVDPGIEIQHLGEYGYGIKDFLGQHEGLLERLLEGQIAAPELRPAG